MTGGALQASRSSGSRCRGRVGGSRVVQRLGIATRGAGDRHPQDPARRRDHAGEPVVRQLLRDVSRAPTASRWRNGVPTVCVPDAAAGRCVQAVSRSLRRQRWRSARPRRRGRATSTAGRWTVSCASGAGRKGPCTDPDDPACVPARSAVDVMGYHTQSDIPNYWSVRRRLRAAGPHVRAERVVEPARAPVHGLGLVGGLHPPRRSGSSCRNAIQTPGGQAAHRRSVASELASDAPIYAWTDLTYLLHTHRRLVGLLRRARDRARLRESDARSAARRSRRARARPGSGTRCRTSTRCGTTVKLGNIQSVQEFYDAAEARHAAAGLVGRPVGRGERASAGARQQRGRLRDQPHQRGHAQAPTGARPRSSSRGTTGAASTTTSLPPRVDVNGYGLRVPALVISPYAKKGYVDHQTLSFDAYVKFIEDDFLGGQRLDPRDRRSARPAPDGPRERADPRQPRRATSTSPRRPGRRCCSRCIPGRPSSADADFPLVSRVRIVRARPSERKGER